MNLSRIDSPITAMTYTLPATSFAGLVEGVHFIDVSAQDALGNWGVSGTITLTLDQTGPAAPAPTLSPNDLNLSGAPPVTHVRLEAVVEDELAAGVQSALANAEGFVGNQGADGTGFAVFAKDGLFDETSEEVYFDIPIANFLYLAQGDHSVWLHGLDRAGNWGAFGSATVSIDRGVTSDTVGPNVSALNVSPNPTEGAATATLTGSAVDADLVSNILEAEYYLNRNQAEGLGVPLFAVDGAFDSPAEQVTRILNVGLWRNRTWTVYVRAQDVAGNWGPSGTVSVIVNGNAVRQILADDFESGDLAAWTNIVGAVSATSAASLAPDGSTAGLQTEVNGTAPAYVSSLLGAEETYQASFTFDPNGTEMGALHHDIFVGWNDQVPIFGIQVGASATAGRYEVRGWALANGERLVTRWYQVTDAPHQLQIGWAAGADGFLSLGIDSSIVDELAGLDTSAHTLYEVRLGPSANLTPDLSGVEFFDSFESLREAEAPQVPTFRLFLPVIAR
jgi:hypothetical protein